MVTLHDVSSAITRMAVASDRGDQTPGGGTQRRQEFITKYGITPEFWLTNPDANTLPESVFQKVFGEEVTRRSAAARRGIRRSGFEHLLPASPEAPLGNVINRLNEILSEKRASEEVVSLEDPRELELIKSGQTTRAPSAQFLADFYNDALGDALSSSEETSFFQRIKNNYNQTIFDIFGQSPDTPLTDPLRQFKGPDIFNPQDQLFSREGQTPFSGFLEDIGLFNEPSTPDFSKTFGDKITETIDKAKESVTNVVTGGGGSIGNKLQNSGLLLLGGAVLALILARK